jgi:hypothetical protein
LSVQVGQTSAKCLILKGLLLGEWAVPELTELAAGWEGIAATASRWFSS